MRFVILSQDILKQKNNLIILKSATLDALRSVPEIKNSYIEKATTHLPELALKLLLPINPTLIYVCKIK